MEEFTIQGKIAVNSDDAQNQLNKLNQQLQERQIANLNRLSTAAMTSGIVLASLGSAWAKAAAQAEQSDIALTTALKNTGQYSAETMTQIDALITSVRKSAKIDDDAQKSALAFGISIGLTEQEATALLPRLADLSKVTGIDLQSAFRASKMALEGSTGMFQRYGVTVEKSGANTVTLASLLHGLSAYSGQAKAQTSGLNGSISGLQTSIQQLSESFGKTLIPTMQRGVDKITNMVDKLNDLPTPMKETIAEVTMLSASLLIAVSAIGKVATGLIAFKSALVGSGIISLLSGPVGIALVAIGAGVAGIAALKKLAKKNYESEGYGVVGTPAERSHVVNQGVLRDDVTIQRFQRTPGTYGNGKTTAAVTKAHQYTEQQIEDNQKIAEELYRTKHTEEQNELYDLAQEVAAYKAAGDDKVLIAQYSAAKRTEIEKKYAKQSAQWSAISVSGVNVSGLSAYIGSLAGTHVQREEVRLTLRVDGTAIKVDQGALTKLKETLGNVVFQKVMKALGGAAAFGG